MAQQVRGAHTFGGPEISTDHYMVVSKIESWSKWRKVRNILEYIYLPYEKSIQKRVSVFCIRRG